MCAFHTPERFSIIAITWCWAFCQGNPNANVAANRTKPDCWALGCLCEWREVPARFVCQLARTVMEVLCKDSLCELKAHHQPLMASLTLVQQMKENDGNCQRLVRARRGRWTRWEDPRVNFCNKRGVHLWSMRSWPPDAWQRHADALCKYCATGRIV